MDIEFDQSKSDRNEADRGFDFAFAALIFDGPTVEMADDRRDYGELRMRAIGEINGSVLTVVYTDRDDVRRIISARKANRRERTLWQTSA